MNEIQTLNLNVAELSNVYKLNSELSERAKQAMEGELINLPANLKELDVITGDEIETRINALRVKANASLKLNKDRRMQYTRRFDELKSSFIEFEKIIEVSAGKLTEWANAWNSEKHRRREEEKKAQEARMAKQNALIEFEHYIRQELNARLDAIISSTRDQMRKKFYSLTLENIDQAKTELETLCNRSFEENFLFQPAAHPLLEISEMNNIHLNVRNEFSAEASKMLSKAIQDEISVLSDSVPGRKQELIRIQNDEAERLKVEQRIAQEDAERKAQAQREAEERKAQNEAEKNAAKMDVAFENAAIGPATQLSSGTQVKLKYDVQTHKQMLLIIQWWVSNSLPLLTVDEMNKKLSFMRTAANSALNKGEVIDGVPTAEDVRTRAIKK
ncbi:MAG: hypothetical protein H3C36_02065 [Chitinophagaceae bacterium]|nr:hypothetical protein [Chitinophagaceae bacterium]